jgi:hypothetical protein
MSAIPQKRTLADDTRMSPEVPTSGLIVYVSNAGYAQFMRGVIAIGGVVAVTLAACNRSQPVALDTRPPAVSPASSSPDDPPSTGSVAQSPAAATKASQVECSREVAAQIVRVEHTLQASNDPCVVYWRSMEVRQHPERSSYLECSGLKAYPDPQPKGHPVSLTECDRQLRERQARMAVPVTGMSDDQKATYRATWGK